MKQNITRKLVKCINPECRTMFYDYDGSGYCETCTPPENIRASRYEDEIEQHPFQPRRLRRSYDDQ